MLVHGGGEEKHMPRPIMNISRHHQMLRKAVSDVTTEIGKLGEDFEAIVELEETIVQVSCECCGLKEDCTIEYVSRIRNSFSGKWVCGLCSEVLKERFDRGPVDVEEAMIRHMNFVQETRLNPKLSLAWAMRDIVKRSCERRKSNLSRSNKIISRTTSCVPRIENHDIA